jgi:hypothetical protein
MEPLYEFRDKIGSKNIDFYTKLTTRTERPGIWGKQILLVLMTKWQ